MNSIAIASTAQMQALPCIKSAPNYDAFGAELEALRPRLENRARGMCKCQNEAEDLASTAILKAWGARETYTPGTNMYAWVSFIMRNEYIMRLRRARFSGGSTEDLPEKAMPIWMGNQESYIELLELERALKQINPLYSEAVIMIGSGATYQEVADHLMICVGTVKSRVTRGRHLLRAMFA